MRRKKGQSILEYTLLITAVVLAVVYGANVIISQKAKAHMDTAGAIIQKADDELKTATGTGAPAPVPGS